MTLYNSYIMSFLKDMGYLHYFLGIEVTRSTTGCLYLCQQKYIRDLLDKSFMANAKSVHTPLISFSVLSKDDRDRFSDPTEYRSLAGALQYVVLTRLNIAYAKQEVVPRSITETEDRILATATRDVTWLVSLLNELQIHSNDPLALWCDNTSAMAVTANLVLHSKFKHVELDLFFVRKKVANGSIVVGEVLAYDQILDVLTKPLSVHTFARFHSLLQVLPVENMSEW
ncbi:alanine--tRNA ligase-like [Gossypium australe]|uniref:Alanine--tRNA ligase-like n=1 Tax=Gossypium australe TaxID=47621 RepID=A0A5B6WZH2_9ROSI|nr:alanine--tRNA ligase-like [Gossypium australe]